MLTNFIFRNLQVYVVVSNTEFLFPLSMFLCWATLIPYTDPGHETAHVHPVSRPLCCPLYVFGDHNVHPRLLK